mmetsp:Transcript_6073/g.15490  ORF Transcript_6073/g.15490 Transcript_6073/m.15490 type:complete len:387 (-) Transcript_6073:7-1167(-)
MEALSYVNSQRVVAILEDTLDKLAFLASITPDVLAHRDELSEFVGDEISRVIEEQRKLEVRYEELVAKRGMLKGMANKTKYKQNQQEIQEVSRALRESTKNLCRNLKDNPNVTGNLLKIQDERNELESLIAKTIDEIRERRTFATLVNHVDETRREQDRLAQVVEKEKNTANIVKELEDQLEQESKQHEADESERRAEISKLKEELRSVRADLTFKTQYSRREAQAKLSSTVREYEQEEADLVERIENLKRMKDMEQEVHASTIEFLTRRQETLLEQAAEWTDKYSNDMEELESQLAELTEVRERDLARLRELQERWDARVAEEAARAEEARRQVELEELRRQEEEEAAAAAVKIQRYYKRFAIRRGPANDKKGKKGGKKGKGKKK